MKDRMIFTAISFLATLLTAGALFYKSQSPLRCAEDQLDEALGVVNPSVYWRLWRMLRMEINPDSIFRDSDSPEIRQLKQTYVSALKDRGRTSRPALHALLIGLSLTLVISILEH